MILRDLSPFAKPPSVARLMRDELDVLLREQYLEDKRADYHRAQSDALCERVAKLTDLLHSSKSLEK